MLTSLIRSKKQNYVTLIQDRLKELEHDNPVEVFFNYVNTKSRPDV